MTDAPQESDALIGRTIAGRYRVERRIARGGMGIVYVATHLRLQRPVVFKVLSEHLADDERASARFEQEALGLSRLNHPNVVTVHDFGIEDGVTYIVMEYVPGMTLGDLLRRDGVMTFERFLPLAAQIIEAIGAAHEKEIVHRDIKPANIMVVSEPGHPDLVKVLDFGLARLTSSSLDITKDNLVGTVSYVAPEVVKGSRAGKASDVYALGVLFYFLLTGRKPFKAEDDLSVLYKHVHDAPVPMAELLPPEHDVPLAFTELIDGCLRKDPDARPADGRELLERLSSIVPLPTRPRIASDEFMVASQTNIAKHRADEELPFLNVVPAPVPPIEGSLELSSISLRERPNSRWGIPLIALCVFAAGAAAVLFFHDRQSSTADAETSDIVAPTHTASDSPEVDVEAGGANDSSGSLDSVEAVDDEVQKEGDAAYGTDNADIQPAKRGTGERTGKPGIKTETRKAEGKKSKPSRSDAAQPSSDTTPAKAAPSGGTDDSVETIETGSGEPGLLEVDDGTGGGLLPVE